MSALICIDFGNTYTKIGIRPDKGVQSEVLHDDSLKGFGEINMFIPTVASRLERYGKEMWSFGIDVTQYRAKTPDLKIFRNWKPNFFKGVETNLLTAQPALVSGTPKKSLSNDEWALVQKMLGLDDSARSIIERLRNGNGHEAESNGQAAKVEETDMDIKAIGLGFFKWLREFVAPVCKKRGIGAIEKIPVRITLPSFGSTAKAELLLKELLEEAGWKLDKKNPTLSEPLANAIGTFTEGLNVTHKPMGSRRKMPHYGEMFQNTGLLQVMREAILENGRKVSWVMIADLGGYTLDFAMVGLDLTDIDGSFEGTIDGLPRKETHSESIGVTTLDSRIYGSLDSEKRVVIDELASHPDQKQLESCHRLMYGKLGGIGGIRIRNVGIGVDGNEKRQLGNCLDQFSEEIADRAQKFLQLHQYQQVDDLILTGGGMMIPSIRQAIIKKLQKEYGIRKVHMHETGVADVHHNMSLGLVRGATALGGASIFFDFAE